MSSEVMLLRACVCDSFMQGAMQHVICLQQRRSKWMRGLKASFFIYSLISTAEPHNLSPNSLNPLDCPMPYMPCRCCEYKSHPILSHLESLLPNYFSQKAKRTHFLQGGERSWQQTTQAGSYSSLGGFVWISHRTATKLLHFPVLATSQQAESFYQM